MKTGLAVVVAIGAAAALYLYARRSHAMAAKPGFTSLGNVGGVTHSPDVTTGGAVSVLGKVLPSLTSWFGGGSPSPAAVPVDQYTPPAGMSTTIWNPVSASPAVLPYSYKQQNIDTPALLNTDSLFTPTPDGASSGAYVDNSADYVDGSSVGFA